MSAMMPYTKRENEIIREMHAKGFGYDEIANVLVTRNAKSIKDHGYDLGLKWSKSPEIDEEAFKRKMKERGISHGSDRR